MLYILWNWTCTKCGRWRSAWYRWRSGPPCSPWYVEGVALGITWADAGCGTWAGTGCSTVFSTNGYRMMKLNWFNYCSFDSSNQEVRQVWYLQYYFSGLTSNQTSASPSLSRYITIQIQVTQEFLQKKQNSKLVSID